MLTTGVLRHFYDNSWTKRAINFIKCLNCTPDSDAITADIKNKMENRTTNSKKYLLCL